MYHKLTLLIAILIGFSGLAQPDHPPRDFKKVEAYKTRFLTEKMDLSTEEAQRFWPVYNEYNKQLQELFKNRMENMSRREIRDRWEKMDDAQLEEVVLNELENQKKIADLKISYYPKFKEAVGSRKASTFYRSEVEFHRHLMEMLGKRRRKRP